MDKVSKTLMDLISIPSECSRSNSEIVSYIDSRLSQFDCQRWTYTKDNLNQAIHLENMMVKIEGKGDTRPRIFVGHTDTVNAGDGWKEDPFSPCVHERKMYGLGASDMKGALACMIEAASSISQTPPHDIYLLFDADEEDGGTGGKKMVQDVLLNNGCVIIGEPTNHAMVYAHRGCLDLEIIVPGKEMHSGKATHHYNEHNNAIIRAMRICHTLHKYASSIESRVDKFLGRSSLTIGSINGGKGANTVAGTCTLKISRRVLPDEGLEFAYDEIREKILTECPDAQITSIFSGTPFLTNPNNNFIHWLRNIARHYLNEITLETHLGWTEAALFSQYGNAVIFGPGSTERIHQPGEFIDIDDLTKFTKIYNQVMQGNYSTT